MFPVSRLMAAVAVGGGVSRLDALIDGIYRNEANLLEDLAVSTLLFAGISVAWSYAPSAWPQMIYYIVLGITLFGYFAYASPAPNTSEED
jgi:hypothetical protein